MFTNIHRPAFTILQNRPESWEGAALRYPLCTVKHRRSFCLVCLVLPLPASQEFSTLGLLNFHMDQSKITIQQLYSPRLKKKKFIVQCLGKADTRTASPTALAITIRRGGKKSCLIRPRESFKKMKKKILSQLGLKNFFSKKTTPRGQKLHFSHMLGVGIGSRFLGVFLSALITGVFYSSGDNPGCS